MKKIIGLSFLIFLQACATQNNIDNSPQYLFAFEKKQGQKSAEKTHDLILSKKCKSSFVYLGLFEAIKRDDYEKVVLYADELSKNNPEVFALAEGITWLYNKGHLKDAKRITEQSLHSLPNELPLILMYAELIEQTKEDEKGDFSAPIALLNSYIKNNPQDYNGYVELGVLYYKMGDYNQAYKTFLRIPEKKRLNTVTIYMGICLKKMNRYAEANRFLLKALKVAPKDKTALHQLGEVAELQHNYPRARYYYQQILKDEPTNYDYLLKLISLSFKEGNHQKAFELAKSNMEFDFIVAASSMLIQEGRADLAEELLEKLSQTPDAPRDLIYLQGALIYEAGKDKQRALSYLLQVTPEDTYYKNALEIIIHLYLEQNDFESAIPVIKKAQKIAPEERNFYVLEYHTYLFIEDNEKAYEALSKYLEKYPDDNEAKFRFAYVCFKLGEKKKSLKYMEEILASEPNNYDALNFIGYTLVEEEKDLKRAEEYLLKADKLNPNHDYINDSLAWLYYTLEDYEKAWVYIQRAVGFIKKDARPDATLWEHYGDIARKLNNKDEARKGYDTSLSIEKNNAIEEKLKSL